MRAADPLTRAIQFRLLSQRKSLYSPKKPPEELYRKSAEVHQPIDSQPEEYSLDAKSWARASDANSCGRQSGRLCVRASMY